MPHDTFLGYLELVEREADDDRNFVKKAVNWALRGIGKRNRRLNGLAIQTAQAIQQQDSVGMAVFDNELKRYIKPSNSPGQWRIITQELTQIPRRKKTDTGRILDQLAEKLTHRSLLVLLSDFFDDIDGINQGLRHLRYKKHELMVFQVLDPLEIEFPFEEVTLFKGLEEMGELLSEPRSLRDGYLEQLAQATEGLKKISRSMHIDFTRMNSGEPLDVSLSGFLATRAASIK